MPRSWRGRWRGLLVLGLLSSGMVVVGVGSPPASGAVTAVSGRAFGYSLIDMRIFGSDPYNRGFGQTIPPGTPESASPSVELPPGGSASPIATTDADGVKGRADVATFFGGIWPENVRVPPPSGPISVSTQGTPGGGSVTSSVDIVLNPTPIEVGCELGFSPPCTSPGGFGPGHYPAEGEQLHSTCTATEAGVTGSTTFVNGTLILVTDEVGDVVLQEPIPDAPPPNYTRPGRLGHIPDFFTIVLNEQIVNPDGSLTVNGLHLTAEGPTAYGELIVGQVQCGLTSDGTTTTTGGGTTSTTGATTTSSSSSTTSSTTSSTSSTTSSTTTTTTVGNTTTTRNPATGTTTPVGGTSAGGTSVGSGSLEKNLGQLARTGAELRGLLVLGFVAVLLGWFFTLGARARDG